VDTESLVRKFRRLLGHLVELFDVSHSPPSRRKKQAVAAPLPFLAGLVSEEARVPAQENACPGPLGYPRLVCVVPVVCEGGRVERPRFHGRVREVVVVHPEEVGEGGDLEVDREARQVRLQARGDGRTHQAVIGGTSRKRDRDLCSPHLAARGAVLPQPDGIHEVGRPADRVGR
jgi:hypothetical protein